MSKLLAVVLASGLAACAGLPQGERAAPACAAGEATYACQVERYHNVSAD